MEEELRQLKIKRAQVKSSLTRFNSFIDRFSEDQVLQLESRLDQAIQFLDHFNSVQDRIEYLDEQELESDDRIIFENRFYEIIQKAKQLLHDFHKKQVNDDMSCVQSDLNCHNRGTTSNVRFPVLELPKFYGDYDKWGQFRDMFTALVHKDDSMDNIKKFYYLLSCLKGDASKILECIEVTNDNYFTAWDLLKSRYENRTVIIKNHVKAIVDLPAVTKDTHVSLRKLTDDFQKHFRSLKNLGEPVDHWDTLLIYIITRKLDSHSEKEWEELVISQKILSPKISDLIDFLMQRCLILETIDRGKSSEGRPDYKVDQHKYKYTGSFKKSSNDRTFSGSSTHNVIKMSCFFCKQNHPIYLCEKFKALPVASRLSEIKNQKLCINCLRKNHCVSECLAQGCKRCSQRHNTMLHMDKSNSNTVPRLVSNTTPNEANNQNSNYVSIQSNDIPSDQSLMSTNVSSNYSGNHNMQILLSTAVVLIRDHRNQWHKCRALLDNGSQPNFITRNLSEKLRLPYSKTNAPVSGVGNLQTNINVVINASIKSQYSDFSADLSFLVLDQITENLPTYSFDISKLNIPADVILADEECDISKEIDLLLGASIFYDILGSGSFKLGEGLPVLQPTLFGWVISGTLPNNYHNEIRTNRFTCNLSVNIPISLEDQLERFWRIEEISYKKFESVEERECEETFIQTTQRDQSGHFLVTLPIRENSGILGDSMQNAVKRLYAMERKFRRKPEFKKQYTDFMTEYEALGHMSKINSDQIYNKPLTDIFYLPHHGVMNESSLTTKLRVVFDGSCKTTSGVSLNDKLKVGPTIQDDLFAILIRFRKHNFVMASDVAKMYRQINIIPQQRDLQRILWRPNCNEDIQHYQLNTVTYGTSCASYLAIRSLHQVAIDKKDSHPEACDVIFHDFYVDDLISGSDSIENAIKLKKDLHEILSEYGFHLRKWVSNNPLILEDSNIVSYDQYYITDNETTKTLGLVWKAHSDILIYSIDANTFKFNNITKRSILSAVSKIFDPLGLISPVTICAKMMLQHLWQEKLGWDDTPSIHIIELWKQFSNELLDLNQIKIPRHVLIFDFERISLHGFCDASQKAYGACIYLKSIDKNNEMKVNLLCGKSRVAPLKTITLPRLELCGAVLLAQLSAKVIRSLKVSINEIHYWSDSNIVLSWLAKSPNTLNTFVANRVAEILRLTNSDQWGHVPSTKNPADIVSRGINPRNLITCELWWSGPEFLLSKDNFDKNFELITDLPELRKCGVALTNMTVDTSDRFILFERYSTLYRIKRVVALCYRFFRNISTNKTAKVTGEVTLDEAENALIALIRCSQAESFPNEINLIRNSKSIPKYSKLISLNPFIDSDDILRVGGRLSKANISYDTKHPIILSSKHHMTRLIILNEHYRHLHAGTQTLLSILRQRYWPINGRSTVRNILRRCIICFRANPTNIIRKMADLPEERITPNRPFSVVGIDFAGPFNIKDGKLRNRAIIKAYLCIFICFSTKAVHLETVSDLSTHGFLNALKRFVSRRGLCKMIYSDNGSNFVGANNELKRIYDSLANFIKDPNLIEFFLQNRIKWQFIAPYSPHLGGLWEAAVKRAKFHVTRAVSNTNTLTFEQLSTYFSQIEAIINSRPITPLSCDPNDLAALTPGHFLIGDSLISIPEVDLMSIPGNRLNQYHMIQQATQMFWKRWSTEYLNLLQQRSKWTENSPEIIRDNSLVLLIDDNAPSMCWKIGRIMQLHCGSDGIARTATIRTPTGVTKRAVTKLCLLPMDDELNN